MKSYFLLCSISFLILVSAIILYSCSKEEIIIPDDMVLIEKGEFIMGSNDYLKNKDKGNKEQFKRDKPLFADEYPERKVFLSAFLIDKFEVSNKKYSKYNNLYLYPLGMENHPAAKVSWFEASRYCKTLKKRLPTEEEWEKAARGPNGNIFPWGNKFDSSFANVGRAKLNNTTPVGLFEKGKSFYGVYDMVGNVGEWTGSWYKPYPNSTYKNQDFGNKYRVIRGSSWGGIGHYKMDAYDRASYRRSHDPGAKIPDVGFRCAKDL